MIGVFNDIDSLWEYVIASLIDEGTNLRSRDGGCVEQLGAQLTLLDIESNFLMNQGRRLSPIYAAGEMLWYLSGSDDGKQIRHYAPAYKRFLEPNGKAWGAYGERWKREAQIQLLVKMLEEQPETRQAIITMWRPSDLFEATLKRKNDIPCTISLQFFRRAGKLHLITTMRSNDAWFGLPYDIFCFTTLQALLAETLGIEFGHYTHQVGSMHLYDRHAERAEEALVIGGMAKRFEHHRSPKTLVAGMERIVQMERDLRERVNRYDPETVRLIIEEFGAYTRWSMLLGLAWMQNLPPLTTDSEYDGFNTMVPPVLWMQASEIRRTQKR